jgi:hypothetical protein
VFKYLVVTAITGLFVIMAISPIVISEDIPYYYDWYNETPRLYFNCNQTVVYVNNNETGEAYVTHGPTGYESSLIFARENFHQSSNFSYGYFGGFIKIYNNKSLIISINDVKDRFFYPDIESEIYLQIQPIYSSGSIDIQLRSDGDGDGVFEYIVDFARTEIQYELLLKPSSFTGVPKDMSNGTIEFEILPTVESSNNISILGGPEGGSWIQVPFDKDTDSDGIGDYSDPDDDGDGCPDSEDYYPKNSKEWKDDDHDWIPDNRDQDDNNNGIPDVYDLPLAMLIISIPIILPIVVLYLNRRDKAIENKKNQDNPPNKLQNQ